MPHVGTTKKVSAELLCLTLLSEKPMYVYEITQEISRRSQGYLELAEAAIQRTRDFFSSLGLPAALSELGIGPEHFREMARKARTSGFDKTFVPLSEEDIVNIYRMSL